MKSAFSGVAAVAFAALAFAAPAHAVTYSVNFDSAFYDLTALVTTDASDNVVTISGSVTGGPQGGAIDGLIAVGTAPYTAYWVWDNLFTASGPHVTNPGVLFGIFGGSAANLYTVGSITYLSLGISNLGHYDPGDAGRLTVSTVPLPPALVLIGSALLTLAGVSRRTRKA